MSTTSANPFGAADSALGYLYQCRYALLLLLRRSRSDEASEISIERFDDIAFHEGATAVEMLQSKHHLRGRGNLSDASADLWKTLRVWTETFLAGRLVLPGTLLALVTTANAPNESIAALLRPERRSEAETEALRRLEEVARTSRSRDPVLQAFHELFLATLSAPQRLELVRAIVILDQQPNILDLQSKINEELGNTTYKEHLGAMVRGVEGWWFQTVVQHMAGVAGCETIRATDLAGQIQDIREGQRKSTLPINFCFADVPFDPDPQGDGRLFVRQLRVVNCNLVTISAAICEHYKASAERSAWIRERQLGLDESIRYDKHLVEEWKRQFEFMKEDLSETPSQDEEWQKGRGLYRQTLDRQIPIRPDCTQPIIMRGSYHGLADELKVGWHPRFDDLFAAEQAAEENNE